MEHTCMPMVGDRIKVVTAPHMEGHDEGTVRQTVFGALGIEFDSAPGQVHQWYLPTEVMVTEQAMQPEYDPAEEPMNSRNRHKLLVTNWRKSFKRRFEAKLNSNDRTAELYVFDVIGGNYFGEGLTAIRFEQALAELGDVKEITVHINSPGGLISDGMAMYNALLRHPATIITNVVGMAASAAAFLLQAGDERRMGETTKAMVHNSQGITLGDRRDNLKMADILGKYDITIGNLFAKRSGRRVETWRKLMDDETYFMAAEALDHRLIDTIVPAKGTDSKTKNKLDLSAFGYKPAPEPQAESATTVISACMPTEEGDDDNDDNSAELVASKQTVPIASTPDDETATTVTGETAQAVEPKYSTEAISARLRVLELDAV